MGVESVNRCSHPTLTLSHNGNFIHGTLGAEIDLDD